MSLVDDPSPYNFPRTKVPSSSKFRHAGYFSSPFRHGSDSRCASRRIFQLREMTSRAKIFLSKFSLFFFFFNAKFSRDSEIRQSREIDQI